MSRCARPLTLPTLAGAALLALAASAQAAVIDSLPYSGTPDWTDIVFGDTVMSHSAGQTTLATVPFEGVWFGWGVWYNDQPAWNPGSNAAGNHLTIQASFSSGSADWSAYFFDARAYAALQFNPTGCTAQNCYGQPTQAGVEVWHAKDGDASLPASSFIPLDLQTPHRFEFLLKADQVSYRIDGQQVYAGAAYLSNLGVPLLVIGDSSGSTGTGVGSMTLYGISLDTAPAADVLTSSVPEPSGAALALAGLALLAGVARRR